MSVGMSALRNFSLFDVAKSNLRVSDPKQDSRPQQPQKSSKLSTVKSILTGTLPLATQSVETRIANDGVVGDVHKHNPYLKLEKSINSPTYGRGR